VFAVQDDICRSIASALKVELVGPVGAAQPRPEARAHVEYLKGRFQWNHRTTGCETDPIAPRHLTFSSRDRSH
jgi:hypothetical protein